MNKYRTNLEKRTYYHQLIEDLKRERDLGRNAYKMNIEIAKSKFKYMVYNYLLKEGNKVENKSR